MEHVHAVHADSTDAASTSAGIQAPIHSFLPCQSNQTNTMFQYMQLPGQNGKERIQTYNLMVEWKRQTFRTNTDGERSNIDRSQPPGKLRGRQLRAILAGSPRGSHRANQAQTRLRAGARQNTAKTVAVPWPRKQLQSPLANSNGSKGMMML